MSDKYNYVTKITDLGNKKPLIGIRYMDKNNNILILTNKFVSCSPSRGYMYDAIIIHDDKRYSICIREDVLKYIDNLNPFIPSRRDVAYYGIIEKRMAYLVEKQIWRDLIDVCYSTSDRCYKFYGAIGIKICKEWLCFEYFLDDISHMHGYNLINDSNEKHYSMNFYDNYLFTAVSCLEFNPFSCYIVPFSKSQIRNCLNRIDYYNKSGKNLPDNFSEGYISELFIDPYGNKKKSKDFVIGKPIPIFRDYQMAIEANMNNKPAVNNGGSGYIWSMPREFVTSHNSERAPILPIKINGNIQANPVRMIRHVKK